MMCVEFITPQYTQYNKTFIIKDDTRIGLNFKDMKGKWYVYYAPYTDFRKFTPYWTWNDVEGIRFVYQPESFHKIILRSSDFDSIDDYLKAEKELGFQYEITIYRNLADFEILNDPDFESVFKLFRAHTR